MSNARSPREVCSTTIGTSGLTVLASFRFSRSNPSRRRRPSGPPSATARCRSLVATLATHRRRQNQYRRLGQDLWLGGLGGLRGHRLGRFGDDVERLPLGEVLPELLEPPRRLQPLQQLLRRRALG